MSRATLGWDFWVDRGGTFTDVVARRPDGSLVSHKLLSEDPRRYDDAATTAIADLLEVPRGEPLPPDRIRSVKMGTTVATNALLQRRGVPTLLVTTAGFGDVLRIGYQTRPHLFKLDIVLPEMLYSEVLEVDERIAADGTVLCPLDLAVATESMAAARERGMEAVAIVLVHGYRHTEHEAALAAAAREIGFGQVSVSHEVDPLVKIVPRGDTTVADAYLSPILRSYVDAVASRIGTVDAVASRIGTAASSEGPQLKFMQANGGLPFGDGLAASVHHHNRFDAYCLADDLMEIRVKGAGPRVEAFRAAEVTHLAAMCAICKSQFARVFPAYGFDREQVISVHHLVGDAVRLDPRP